jgi:hypothetical protein
MLWVKAIHTQFSVGRTETTVTVAKFGVGEGILSFVPLSQPYGQESEKADMLLGPSENALSSLHDPWPKQNPAISFQPESSGFCCTWVVSSVSIQFSSLREKELKRADTFMCRNVTPCKKITTLIYLTTTSQNLLGCCYSNPQRTYPQTPNPISSSIPIPDNHHPSEAVSLTLHPPSEDPKQKDRK